MHHGTINKMTGTVEADEAFIGGKARNMHKGKREEVIHGRGPMGKAIVFALPERETGKVRTSVIGMRWKHHLHNQIARTSPLFDGTVHTNRRENFWSLLKRAFVAPMLALSRFVCSVTLMSNRFATMSELRPMQSVSIKYLGR